VESFQAEYAIDDRSLKGLTGLPPSDQVIVMDVVSSQQCKNPSAVTWSCVRQMQTRPHQMRLEYILRNIDERANEALSKLHPMVQQNVASQVDVLQCRNLSAFVFSQVKNAARITPRLVQEPLAPWRAQAVTSAGRARSRTPLPLGRPLIAGHGARMASKPQLLSASSSVDAVLLHHGLDDMAQKALSQLDREDQCIVAGLVEKQEPRNPSAVTWSMCKFVKNKPLEAKMEFIKISVDGEAQAALQRLTPQQQEEILSQVEVSKTRNLSAFVWSRVKAMTPSPKDGMSNSLESTDKAELEEQPLAFEESENDLATELGIVLDERCLAALRELPSDEQIRILEEVDPATTRNPSAFVWSRVKAAKARQR